MFKLTTYLVLFLGLRTIGLAQRIFTSIEEGKLAENSIDNTSLIRIYIVIKFAGIRDYSPVNTNPFVKIGNRIT